MSVTKSPMTVLGKQKLEEELKHLISVERPKVIKAIEEARAHGDLSENADYDAAKEKQAFIESRIADIQSKIVTAEVIDPSKLSSDKIVFGAEVELEDLDSETKVTYQIVGEDEADVKEGKISIYSPLARALIGRKKGDDIEVFSPKGQKEYSILNFQFK